MPLFKRARGGVTSHQIVASDIDIATLDTDLTSISASHDTIPSAKAVVDFIGDSSSVSGLTDTTISSVSDNNQLQYDSVSGKWINKNYIDFSVITAPTAPGAEEGRLYLKEINSQNNALAIKIQKAGNVVEVELTSPGCVCGVCGSEDGAKDPIFNFQTGIIIVELYCGHSYEMDIPNLRRIQ
jgi:hypothetical protein